MKANLKLLNLPNFESLKTRKVSDIYFLLQLNRQDNQSHGKGIGEVFNNVYIGLEITILIFIVHLLRKT